MTMKDARFKAFSMIRSRIERARTALRETLATQQNERDEASAKLADQQDVLARAAAEVERREARIDSLLDGTRPVRIEELLDWQKLLADAVTQRAHELDTLARMRDALGAIEEKIAATRTAIVRHDVRIDMCNTRLDALRREAEARADEVQDEESEEAFVARRLSRAAAQRRRASAEAAR
jgi:chromosome segregation ATPase